MNCSPIVMVLLLFAACTTDNRNGGYAGSAAMPPPDPVVGTDPGAANANGGAPGGAGGAVPGTGGGVPAANGGATPGGSGGENASGGASGGSSGGAGSGTGGTVPMEEDAGTLSDGGLAVSDVEPVADAADDTDNTVDSGGADGDASDQSDAESAPEACEGKPGMLRGTSDETFMAGGSERTFIYHAPTDLDPNTPVPLVIVPHGSTMSGKQMYDITQYAALADREGFVVIFPDGDPENGFLPLTRLAPWNVGEDICPPGDLVAGVLDDQAYVDELIAFADADQCIDHDHIFMTGFSMGGYFCNENACLRSDIRAVAPHSGGSHDLSACPQGPKPVMIMHFQGDQMIPYDCGLEARDRWVEHNGCSTTASDVREVLGGTCEYYDDCPADGQVAMCSFQGLDGKVPTGLLDSIEAEVPAGHAWSGGSIDGEGAVAAISVTESATELSWAFFMEYAW